MYKNHKFTHDTVMSRIHLCYGSHNPEMSDCKKCRKDGVKVVINWPFSPSTIDLLCSLVRLG